MKKAIYVILAAALMLAALCGCGDRSALDAKNPVTLTMWHVYGEQANSPMNRLVDEFKRTVGQENGVVIDVTLMSSTAQIGEKLLDAQRGTPGVPSMPDLFFCHNNNAAELGAENLLDWNDVFESAELESYIPAFLDDGMVNGHLSVFPVSKSTHVLCVAGCQFDRFAADTDVSYDDLATWDGFFDVAEKYYDWSGGEAFSISTLISRQDYNRIAARNAVRIVLLLAMFAVSAVSCCLYFSRRYLKPVKESLERIRRREYEGAPFEAIDDLFAFLAEQDRVNEAAIDRAEQEKANALASLEQMQEQHNAAQRQLARLAYSRKSEVDPADYEAFRSGLHELTETERRVFDYYLAGKSVKEIIELMGVRETTIRFHNRNIYAKLGENSLKQLLRCAAILQQEEGQEQQP